MQFKDGVFTRVTVVKKGLETIVDISKEARHAMVVADIVSKELTGKELVVTSVLDGKHMVGSKHYVGDAFDMRTFIYTKDQIQKILNKLRQELGRAYDVVFETDHIHIEYDPK